MLILASLALAQSPDTEDLPEEGSTPVIYERVTEHTFDGVKVKGAVVGPDGIVTIERRRAIFNPLIRLRINFDDALAASVEEVQ
ncbi:MAG: hypothetical protein FJ102_05890 [Deltaproteobacteria bacterium]|nr:hypothetical protein [Deltaproteobacteria bacterium]